MIPISLLIPTRLRPGKLAVSIRSAIALAAYPKRVHALLRVDSDDPTDYSGYPIVVRGPRWGYQGIHVYFNELAALAFREYRGWMIMWNDDECMLTPGWDEKLIAYGEAAKVVFLRRDKTDPCDTAYPAWPASFWEVVGRCGADSACDTWLSNLTGAADRLLGRTATHVHASDIVVSHERDEEERIRIGGTFQPEGVPSEPRDFPGDVFKLVMHHGGGLFAPPFGLGPGRVPIKKV
jgi:hypothetical protein